MKKTYRGSCHCGKIRFEVDAELDHVRVCDCSGSSRIKGERNANDSLAAGDSWTPENMKRIVVMLGVLALSVAAYGQMYKWVDKEGKTHYTDTPPPADAKSATPPPAARASGAPAKAAADPATPSGKPDGKPEGTQGSFRPEEEVALRTVCVIYLLETLTCELSLHRYCPVDELVKGIGGDPKKGIAKDPRNDPNYEYRVEFRSDDVLISAISKRPGLTGFFSNKSSGTRYNPNGTAGKDDKRIVGPTSCPDFK